MQTSKVSAPMAAAASRARIRACRSMMEGAVHLLKSTAGKFGTSMVSVPPGVATGLQLPCPMCGTDETQDGLHPSCVLEEGCSKRCRIATSSRLIGPRQTVLGERKPRQRGTS